MKKLRLLVISIVAFIGITSASLYLFDNKTCDDCNIVVFDVDIFRADGLDCEKSPEITPNICEFQDEFIKFDNHHSPTDLTKPGMASFLTSSYPTTHGIWNEFYFLDQEQPNIINILEDNGYNSIINTQGKQLVSSDYNTMLDSYIEEFIVSDVIEDEKTFLFLYTGELHYPYLGFESNIITHPNKPVNFPNNMSEFYDSGTDLIIERHPEIIRGSFAQEYIKNNDYSTQGLYFHIMDACWTENSESMINNLDYCWKLIAEVFEQHLDKNNPDRIEFIKYLYQERIKELDKQVGDVIRDLKSNDLWDKTVFMIRSDHGEELMEHGKLSHWNNLYQELVRVPLWIHVPGKDGKTVYNLTQTIDEAPTLLNAVGIEPHPLMEGRNLLNPKDYELDADFAIAQKQFGKTFTLREGAYKLISAKKSKSESSNYELYNLQEDPDEKNNIVETNPEIKEKLLFKYHNIINQQPKFNPTNESLDKLTEEQKNNLYEYGYF